MSKGLSFLNKKGWHPLTLKNQERVWKAEQLQENEQKRIKEIQRKYTEEAKVQELHDIKKEAGLGKAKAERVDWLYQGVPQWGKIDDSLKHAEVEQKEEEDFKTLGLFRNFQSNPVQEAWTKVKEDPLFGIEKLQKVQGDHVRNNPVQMEKIRRTLEQLKKDKRKEKKHKKKEKKRKERREWKEV